MAKQKTVKKKKAKSRINWQSKERTLKSLRRWNIAISGLLALQAMALLLLSNTSTAPITTSYLTKDSLASQTAGKTILAQAWQHLFDIRLSWLIVSILLITALICLLIATRYRAWYENDLKIGTNRFRWLSYALSGGLVLMLVALTNGVSDISTLLSIFALTEILALFCVLLESDKVLKKHLRIGAKILFIAAVTPWLIFAIYLFGAQIYGSPGLPVYVYVLNAIVFVLFAVNATTSWFQYHKVGRWADYLYGECIYMLVNFILLSALTWLVYAGTLQK